MISIPVYAQYSGGTGEPNNPYQIATVSDLISLGENPGHYNKHFILTHDIDLNPNLPGGKVFDKAIIAPDTNPDDYWNYFQGTPFSGILDGNGHTISNLTITGDHYVGLFGQLVSRAMVRDLKLVNVKVTGSGSYVGGLVGCNYGNVIRCCKTGSVDSTGNYVGGLTGYNNGNITHCYSTGSISTNGYCVGGITGQNTGSITNSYTMGMVEGNSYVGGLVGANGEYYNLGAGILIPGLISNCYSTCTVNGSANVGKSSVGGLIGRNWGDTVSDCFWDIQASGLYTSDGGKGLTTVQMQNIHTYLDAGWDWVGEFSNGTHEIWQIPESESYPELVIFSGYTPPKLKGQGTLENPYLISNAMELGAISYYNPYSCYRLVNPIDLSGICWNIAIIPWFSGTFDGNNLTISNLKIIDAGDNYVGMFGELVSDAEVSNLGVVDVNITALGYYIGGLAGINRGSMVQCYNTGSIVGTGDYVGGMVGLNGGSMIGCYSKSTVNGNDIVGGLVGYNDSEVSQCYSQGEVKGNGHVGGLAGGNAGNLVQSYNTSIVTGTGWYSDVYVGGLVGKNDSNVAECYNTGAVTGYEHVGGLVGGNTGSLLQSYSAAEVTGTGLYWDGLVGGLVGENQDGIVNGCFWDIQISGMATSDGGISKTTTQMQTKNTFVNAGWDFVNETANGSSDIWSICENTNYPRFVWQIPVGDYVCPDGLAMNDFAFFMDHWGYINCNQDNGYCEGTDLDFSGVVDIYDYEILINNWLTEY